MSSAKTTIYTGFWINWSYGNVRGSTLTLSPENSAFLVAFLALWVKFVSSHLWAVVTFLTSVVRSTAEPQDGLYHQQQATLRNTSGPLSVSVDMLKLLWFWTGKAINVKTRTFTLALPSLAYAAAFAVAGVFSSKIASNDSEVLLVPVWNCGLWPYPWEIEWDPAESSWQDYSIQRESYFESVSQLIRQSHTYVSQCYNVTRDSPNESCLPYGKSQISWTTTFGAPCPFNEEMCTGEAIQFDTGFLSTQNHLGTNTKDESIEYRRVTSCAPIKTDGYVTDYVDELDLTEYAKVDHNPIEGESWLKYTYGQSYYFNDNTTFAYSNFTWGASYGTSAIFDIYKLETEISFGAPNTTFLETPTFTAIPSLSRGDADTTLVFLSLNGSYLNPVHDPWFRATTSTQVPGLSTANFSKDTAIYNRDAPVNVVACSEQHQLRNPRTGAASRLGGQDVFVDIVALLELNDNQQALFNRTLFIAPKTSLMNTILALGGDQLLAASALNEVGLPVNQWQLEFNHWFGVGLNAIQLWTQQHVTGMRYPELDRYVVPAIHGFGKSMCDNQITRRADYRSFSVLGLCIVLAFGLLFILLNLTIGPIVQRIQSYTLKGRYRNAEWQVNHFLQLQRMAYEHKGIGNWEGQDDMVPRTSPGERFTIPDSTKWNQYVSISPREARRRSQSRSLGRELYDFQPLVASTSSLGMKDRSTISTRDVDMDVQQFETRFKD